MLIKKDVTDWWMNSSLSSEIICMRIKSLCAKDMHTNYCYPNVFSSNTAIQALKDGSFVVRISGYKRKRQLFQLGKPLEAYLVGIPSPIPRKSLPITQTRRDFREKNLEAVLLLGEDRLRVLEGVIAEETLRRSLVDRNKAVLVKYYITAKIKDREYVVTLIADFENQNPSIHFFQDINLVKEELTRMLCCKKKETDVGVINLDGISKFLVQADRFIANPWWL